MKTILHGLGWWWLLATCASASDVLADRCARFCSFDQDGDGSPELGALVAIRPAAGVERKVLVLVERRAWGLGEALQHAVMRYADDLEREGRAAEIVTVEWSSDGRHRDGRIVLALREFLRASGALDGVVLVGRFPDAFLVRTCNWRRRGALKVAAGAERSFESVPYLRSRAEPVARRCDLVLADLDGAWETLYHEHPVAFPSVVAAFPQGVPDHGGEAAGWTLGEDVFRDVFHVNDGRVSLSAGREEDGEVVRLHVRPLDRSVDDECSVDDLTCRNRIARPDLCVSRIDARGVALRPRVDLQDDSGRGLVGDDGQPRAVTREGEGLAWHEVWEYDPDLERRLLVEWFERNHQARSGQQRAPRVPASIACDLGSGYDVMARASSEWAPHDRGDFDVRGRPTLIDVVAWWKRPAALRTVRAHSDAWGSLFQRVADVSELERACGGVPWCWMRQGATWEPTLQPAVKGGKADFFLFRTLWEHGALPRLPSLVLHTGCDGISPPRAATHAADHPAYGLRQGAEAMLFYAGAQALVGRAKVFYDEPRGWAETLSRGGTVGEAWREYYEREARADSWSDVGGDIGRKRSYFWSVLGDWTLTLNHVAEAPPEEGPHDRPN